MPGARTAQPVLQRAQCGPIHRGRLLEPVEHGIGGGIPGTGLQHRHQPRRGVGGGEQPAVFVVHSHACAAEQGADAAGERAVVGHQCHGRLPLRQVLQHTGGGALGLVLGIGHGMQGWHAGLPAVHHLRQVHDKARLCPVPRQRAGQGVGLEALHHHQQRHGRTHARLEQHIPHVARGQYPFQGDARCGGLQPERATVARRRQQGARRLAPVRAPVRSHGRCHHRQLRGHLQQRTAEDFAVRGKTGAVEQCTCGDRIACHIARVLAALRQRRAQLGSPVTRGLEARRETLRVGALPLPARLAHELGIRHQHHGGRQVRAALRGR